MESLLRRLPVSAEWPADASADMQSGFSIIRARSGKRRWEMIQQARMRALARAFRCLTWSSGCCAMDRAEQSASNRD